NDEKSRAAPNILRVIKIHTPRRTRHRRRFDIRRHANKKGRRDAGLLVSIRSAVSISGGSRSTPTKPVVYADLGGVLVVAEAPASDIGGSRGEGGVAEIVILVLGLGRPVRGKHVLEAPADGLAVLVAAVGG